MPIKFRLPFSFTKKNTPEANTTFTNWGGLPNFYPLFQFNSTGSKVTNFDTRTVDGQRNAYMFCPVVTMVINYKVACASNAKFYFENEKTEKEVTSIIQPLIDNPNGNSNWIQFYQFAKTLQQIHGKAYIYVRNLPGIKVPKEMYVIPNWELKINTATGSDFWSDGILNYEWCKSNGQKITIPKEDMMILSDTGYDIGSATGQYQYGGSRLLSLGDAVENIIASFEARKKLLKNGGPPIMLSPAKDGTGAQIMMSDEKKQLEANLQNDYGLQMGKSTINVASVTMNAAKLGINPNDLAAFEEVTEDSMEVCRGYGLSPYLFGFSDTTFDNFDQAEKSAYQNTIIPETQNDCDQIAMYFKLKEEFCADFDDVECLQEAESEKVTQLSEMASMFKTLIDAGVYTAQEVRKIIDNEVMSLTNGKENKKA